MKHSINDLTNYLRTTSFSNFIGLEIYSFQEGNLCASFQLNSMVSRIDGAAHGGMLSYFADSVMGFASLSMVESTQTVFTIELKMAYLRQAKAKTIFCEANVLKAGKRIHFCEAELFVKSKNGEKVIVAKSSASMSVHERKDEQTRIQ